jgi:hypothetical protein
LTQKNASARYDGYVLDYLFKLLGFLRNHWIGITWFLGWGVATWAAIDNWIDKRKRRAVEESRQSSERLALETKVGCQVLRTMALYGGCGPYSENELRSVLKQAGLDENRVLPIVYELEDGGHAERNATLGGSVTWVLK